MDYVNSVILANINPKKLQNKINNAMSSSFKAGKEEKAREIRIALGL